MRKLIVVFCIALTLVQTLPSSAAAIASNRSQRANAQTDYSAVIATLTQFINEQLAEKDLPAISIALVDDQKIVWQEGFGYANPQTKTPPVENTVYRVGSVSKLFTDIAVMQLVEQGKLNLDAPVTNYIPEFRPRNPFGKAITLRQLMSHRSGLVRETPVGSYFDPTEPTLAKTIASLNQTSLVYAPETRTKYSNAAIATVGYVLERTQKTPFAKYLQGAVLEPLGMQASRFEPTPAIKKNLSKAFMWTLDGRTFDAPTFELGIAPAGCMYTTLTDLSKFMSAMFNGGQGASGRFLKRETLEQMWTPQTDAEGNKTAYGIGFRISDLQGHRAIGHGGAIYGFATTLSALPDDKLGVVVVATKDSVNAVTNRIANFALRAMLAAREGKALPQIEKTSAVNPELAIQLAGLYANGEELIELTESAGVLSMFNLKGGSPLRLRFSSLHVENDARSQPRVSGVELIVDDRLGFGEIIKCKENQIVIGGKTFTRVNAEKPKPVSEKLRGLVGEYGWEHDILYILERDGKLWCLIEWYEFDPLEEVSPNVFKFPNRGLYDGEKLIFKRDEKGKVTAVEAAGVVFSRRNVGPEDGVAQLRVKPVRPVAQLLKEALNEEPPQQQGNFRKAELVELTKLDPTIKLDIRYATTNNFLGSVFYQEARAFLQRPAAEALVRAHKKLKEMGYGLLIHDGYRPWFVTKVFWDATPEDKHVFVANPANGSRHNRGCAVDLTLYDLRTGKPIEMVSTYDETTDRAYPDYPGGTTLQRWHRRLLRDAMEAEGFAVYEAEWWHFDYQDWRLYSIGNVPFNKIAQTR
jgi:CubicO group peptidase (beta-lactamase class C family)/D-alanyl-D-alanine dipeptidase